LKHDVQLKSEHLGDSLPVIAKLENIGKPYELDKLRLFHQLYKLADTQLNPTSQKVNLATQVMNHTFAACLNTLLATGKDH
jgi:hypothetical protein